MANVHTQPAPFQPPPLIECLGEGVAIVSAEGTLLYLNRAGRELLDTGEEAHGNPVARLFGSAEDERLKRHARLAAEGLRSSFECPLGESGRVLVVTAQPYRCPAATIPASLWLFRDVSEWRRKEARLQEDLHGLRQTTTALRTENVQLRQQLDEYATELLRAQEALWNSESLYARLVETSPDAIVLMGQQLTIQMFNRQAAALFRLPEDETLMGRFGWEMLARDDARRFLERLDRDLRKNRGSVRQELTLRRLDGETFPGEFSASAIVTPAGKVLGTVLVLRDVSERKMLESELVHAQKMEAVGRLAGGIAHDFNNLLTVIRGSAELAGRRLNERRPLTRLLQQIERAAVRGAALVQHLMTFSRRREGEQQLFTVNHVVAELRPMLEHALTSDIRLEVQLDEQDVALWMTPSSLEQVLLNLLINARDAMPQGGVVRISTRALAACQAVELVVEDTGVGMTPEIRSRIFEPFFTTKEVGKGTGLGLSTVFGIIQRARGSIHVDSEPGRGTRFRLMLPAADAEHAPPGDTAQPERGVLVVVEEDLVRATIRQTLEDAGFTVWTPEGLAAARETLAQVADSVDLLILESRLGSFTGTGLEQKAARQPALLYLFDSQDPPISSDEQFFEMPFQGEELLAKVESLLEEGPPPVVQ